MKRLWQGSQNISSKSDLGRLIIIFLGFLALYLMSNTRIKETVGGAGVQESRNFVAVEIGATELSALGQRWIGRNLTFNPLVGESKGQL